MKISETLKNVETDLLDAVRDLVRDLPNAQIKSVEPNVRIGENREVDGKVEFSLNESNYSIIIEAKPNGAPRYVRSGVHRLESNISRLRRESEGSVCTDAIPMLVSQYLSP